MKRIEELTKEKLEEYAAQLKRGDVELDEFMSGLIAIHGVTRVEDATMNPREFLEHILSFRIPLDQIEMSDELRKEFESMRNSASADFL